MSDEGILDYSGISRKKLEGRTYRSYTRDPDEVYKTKSSVI